MVGDPRRVANVKDPAKDAVPITPSDIAGLPDGMCRAIIVAIDGEIKVITAYNETRTFTVPIGVIPLQVKKVFATGTTAAGLTALY